MSGPRRRAFTVVMDWADVEKWASPVHCAADFSHWLLRRSGYRLSPFIATGKKEPNKVKLVVVFIGVQAGQPPCQAVIVTGTEGMLKDWCSSTDKI